MLSFTVKKLDAFEFDEVAESVNTNHKAIHKRGPHLGEVECGSLFE